MSCCPPGSLPALIPSSSYTPKGSYVKFSKTGNNSKNSVNNKGAASVNCYCVGDLETAAAVVVVVHDIWGMDGGRTRSVADQLSSSSPYYVIVPDFYYDGDNCELHGGLEGLSKSNWITQFTCARFLDDLNTVMEGVLSPPKELKFGIIGFCWGANVVFSACDCDTLPSQFSCGVSLHPSLGLLEKISSPQRSALTVAESLSVPQLLLPAGNDSEDLKAPGGAIVAALKKNEALQKYYSDETVISYCFEQMKHGWVVRGDLDDQQVKEDVASAMKMTQDFLDKYLK